jgi:hypothetical protein
LTLAPALYVFSVHIAHLAFPFLSYHLFGFFCGFPPFNVPMPWCHLLHFGANWLLKAKKKFTATGHVTNNVTTEPKLRKPLTANRTSNADLFDACFTVDLNLQGCII